VTLTWWTPLPVLKGEQVPLKAPHFGGVIPSKDASRADPKLELSRRGEKLAPIFKKQIAAGARASSPTSESVVTRKRSLDKLAAGDSGSEDVDKKRKVARPTDSYRTLEAQERGMNPTYTTPTQWEDLYYQDVEVIQVLRPGAKERIQQLRFAGTPFILEGHEGWTKFAEDWVKPDGSLDSGAFLRGIHDVKVPVIEKNYEEFNPIKTYLPLSYYVKNYWEHGKPDYYMHQWQFPLSPKAGKLLCYKCDELPVLGDNLLLYWLDAVRGDNPLQYLFMGQKTTVSRMHQDPGGLDITIAPIIGTKRVTMLSTATRWTWTSPHSSRSCQRGNARSTLARSSSCRRAHFTLARTRRRVCRTTASTLTASTFRAFSRRSWRRTRRPSTTQRSYGMPHMM